MARSTLVTSSNYRNTRLLIIGLILVLISAAMIYTHITRPKITTTSDLKTVRGPFLGCHSGTRGNYRDITLEADYDKYRIPADFLRCFDEHSFQTTVHGGDPLTLLVNNKLDIFSLSDKSRTFLNADSTIAIYNGSIDIWKGMVLFLIGAGLVAWAVVGDRNRNSR